VKWTDASVQDRTLPTSKCCVDIEVAHIAKVDCVLVIGENNALT